MSTSPTFAVNQTFLNSATLPLSDIAVMANAACSVGTDGRVRCWGTGAATGLGFTGVTPLPSLVTFSDSVWATSISGGSNHVCAVFNTTSANSTLTRVRCWGGNDKGQLGALVSTASLGGAASDMSTLAYINLGASTQVTQVSAGGQHTCVLTATGGVTCFGNNNSGQLGRDSTVNVGLSATDLPLLQQTITFGTTHKATAISAGGFHSCAVFAGAGVRCWGANSVGQLGQNTVSNVGDGTSPVSLLPFISFAGPMPATGVAAGRVHTCVLFLNPLQSNVRCFGEGIKGNLGMDSTSTWGTNTPGASTTSLPFVR